MGRVRVALAAVVIGVTAAGAAACGAAGAGTPAPSAVPPGSGSGPPGYEVVATYPHDPLAYTQGLFWHDGYLYEGTGRYGTSRVRKVDPSTGEVLQEASLADDLFGEGIARHGDRIFQLTWLSKRGFIYDAANFELLGEFSYDTEGWGLTADGTHLILSDGSSSLFFLDPSGQTLVRTVRVLDGDDPVDDLNELEYIDGLIYANVWHSDFIYRIDPQTGAVVDRIDFSGLLADERPSSSEAVLNGIAFNPDSGHLFLTGKLWPKMLEVRLVDSGN